MSEQVPNSMEQGTDLNLTSLPNPYDFANPVIDEAVFAGRDREISDIRYYLNHARKSPRPIHLAIIGDRASGKTSILNMIELMATELGIVVARVDLDESDIASELPFYQRIFDAVLGAVCRTGAYGGVDGAVYEHYRSMIDTFHVPGDNVYHTFRFPLQYVRAMSSGRSDATVSVDDFRIDLEHIQNEIDAPIAILFDECDVLGRSRVHLQKIRNIFQRTRKFMLVLVGTANLFPVFDDVFSPMIRQFKKIAVLPFDRQEETRLCILNPLLALDIPDVNEVFNFRDQSNVADIHVVTGGRPYEVQLLCHFMFRHIELGLATRMELTSDVLDDVRQELATAQDLSLRPMLQSVQGYDDAALVALGYLGSCCGHASLEDMWLAQAVLAPDDLRIEYAAFNEYFEKFLADGVLAIEGGRITFLGDDFDRVYAKCLARKHDALWRVDTRSYQDYLRLSLMMLLARSIFSTRRRRDEENPTSIGIMDHSVEEIESWDLSRHGWFDQELAFADLYQMSFSGDGYLAAVGVDLRVAGLEAVSACCLISGMKPDLGSWVRIELESTQIRAREHNAELAVRELAIPKFEKELLINAVLNDAADNIKEPLAVWHLNQVINEYIVERDRDAAFEHARLVELYSPDRVAQQGANELGYLCLAEGRLEDAKRYLALACEETQEPELAHYNSAIVQACMGNIAGAIIQMENFAAQADNDFLAKEVSCLFVPRWQHDQSELVFQEVWNIVPEVAAANSLQALRLYLTSTESGDNN